MEIVTFLFIFLLVLIMFKAMGLILKTGIFLISIPLQIVAGLVVTLLIIALLPVTLVTGILTALLAPFVILFPLLPILLVGLGIYLVARK